MKALLQRVIHASVSVDGSVVGEIGAGLLVLLGLDRDDDRPDADRMLQRILGYRVFADESGRMNRSVADIDAGVLLVPQFTLSADTGSGMRPGFSGAMPPAEAQQLYRDTLDALEQRHRVVAAGVFGAHMQVSLTNDGPVTFLLQSG